MKIETYNWWGNGNNEPPPHLKTKKQLAEMGLKPVQAVGIIKTQKYDLYLYDPKNPDSAVPKQKRELSEVQKAALDKGRRKKQYEAWYREEGRFLKRLMRDKNDTIDWAQSLLDSNNWVILDTETTGLSSSDEIVQIGVINHQGNILLDFFVKPTIIISDEAIAIHKITNEMVLDAPTFPDIYPKFIEVLQNKKIIIYNANFDIKIIEHCCNLHNLPSPNLKRRSECAMEMYAQFCNEWSNYHDDYRYQPLNGEHTVISDCLAVLALINKMASSGKETFDKYKVKFDTR